MTTRGTALALALGVALTFGAAASEARAASECALSIGIFGISVDVCADSETTREHRTARNERNTPGLDAGNCLTDPTHRGPAPGNNATVRISC